MKQRENDLEKAIRSLAEIASRNHVTEEMRQSASMLLQAYNHERTSGYIRELEARLAHKEWNNRIELDILNLVNASAQVHIFQDESMRLLKEARKVAQIRNEKLDKSYSVMLKEFSK